MIKKSNGAIVGTNGDKDDTWHARDEIMTGSDRIMDFPISKSATADFLFIKKFIQYIHTLQ